MRNLGLALLLSLASAEASSAQTLYHLAYQPKVGDIHKYQIVVDFVYEGGGRMEFASDLLTKVVKIAANGDYDQQEATTNAVIVGETKKELPQQAPKVETYSKNGLPKGASLKDRDPDPFADLLEHLNEFCYPDRGIRLSDEWTNRPVGPKSSFFGQPRLTYRLAELFEEKGHHYARIHYTAVVAGDSDAAAGTILLDRSDNHLYQMRGEIPHFKPEGAREEADVLVSVSEKIIPLAPKAGAKGST